MTDWAHSVTVDLMDLTLITQRFQGQAHLVETSGRRNLAAVTET